MKRTMTETRLPPSRAYANRSILSFLRNALSAKRQRRALRELDDEALNDIGITRAEAEQEATRPFWDVPATWRR